MSGLTDAFVFQHKTARQRPAALEGPMFAMNEQNLQIAFAQGEDDQVNGDGRVIKTAGIVGGGVGGKLFRFHLSFDFGQTTHGNLVDLHASPFIKRATKPCAAKGNAWKGKELG